MGAEVARDLPCDIQGGCGGQTTMKQYTDGKHCYKCNRSVAFDTNHEEYVDTMQNTDLTDTDKEKINELNELYDAAVFKPIKERRITQKTCEVFGVKTDTRGRHLFPCYTTDHKLVALKIIDPSKPKKDKHRFLWMGTRKRIGDHFICGAHAFDKGGRKKLTVVEGEYDMLSTYELNGGFPAVSLWDGSDPKGTEAKRHGEWIMEWDEVYGNFDNDDPGRETREAWGKLLAGRFYYFELDGDPGCDASDYLRSGKVKDYLKQFWGARMYTLAGLINGCDTYELYKNTKDIEPLEIPDIYMGLRDKLYSFYLEEIVLWTAGTGCGKTQMLRKLKHHWLLNTTYPMLDISLEESVGRSVGGLMEVEAEERLMRPDMEVDEERDKAIHSKLFGSKQYWSLDHSGAVDDNNLFDYIEHACAFLGVKIIFIDHLTIAISEVDSGTENNAQDKFMSKMVYFKERYKANIHVVAHLRKTGGTKEKSFEHGRVPKEDDIKGSGSVKQVPDTIVALARDKHHEDEYIKNVTDIYALKGRLLGYTGYACSQYFDPETGVVSAAERVVDDEDFFDEAG